MAKKWGVALVGLLAFGMIANACDSDDSAKTKTDTSVTTTTRTTTKQLPTTTSVAPAPAPLLAPIDTYLAPTTTQYIPPATTEYVVPETTYVAPAPLVSTESDVDVDIPGVVTPGAFCSGGTGVTKKGTPMVCTTAKDGKMRWKSAG